MRAHPLWRGFWLAAVLAAGLVLMGFTDCLDVFRGERRMVAFAGGIALGAFLRALPGWLVRKGKPRLLPTWQHALRAFLCGCFLPLTIGLAGDGRIIPALLTGSAGAWGFGLTALAAGFATTRIMGRVKG